jgi:cell division protein FtsQ
MKNWKFILIRVLWLIGALLLVTLFVFAWQGKSEKKCNAIQVELTGNANGFLFMDEKEILKFINENGVKVGMPIKEVNLINLEKQLNSIKWVEHTNIYFDNLQQLQIKIEQRSPVARIFTVSGNSFYIDKSATRLPLRQLSVIRLPIFTGFPSDQEKLSKPDSILLSDVLHFSLIVKQDSFFLAQIAQININPNGDFEMIPALGDHTVLFGTVENIEDKLNRLYTFYKKVWPSSGINAYQVLDLRFDHQLLALKKGMQPIEYPPGALPDLQPLNMLDSAILIDTVQTKVANAFNISNTKVDSIVNTKLKTTPALNKTATSSKKEIPIVVKKANNKAVIKSKPKLEKNAKKLNNKSTNNTLKQEKKSAKAEMPKKTTSNNN